MVTPLDYVSKEFLRLAALGEHRTKDWIITKSKWSVIGIVTVYLFIVYIFGPAFMKKRKPYNLNKILIIYNTVQITCNLYIFYMAIKIGWFDKYKFICEPIDYSNSSHSILILNLMWEYLLIKIFDLFDTLFFVLRKKQNQVTFLHIYHHSGMVLLVWCAIKITPGGQATFLGVINSFVHMIMYTYYLLTSLHMANIWWKKYVTQLQIFQFFLIALQCFLALLKKDCQFPKLPVLLFLPHNVLMAILFYQFYRTAYVNKKKKSFKKDRIDVINNTNDNNSVKSSSKKNKN